MANLTYPFCLLLVIFYTKSASAFYHSHDVNFHGDGTLDYDHQHDYPPHTRDQGSCNLPSSWHGRWFQSGLNLQAIGIDEKAIATKGICLESQEDKFLFYDRTTNCHRCLVINERHANVLQYKESPDCEPDKDSLENLCSFINGDAQLYSLFRIDAEAEECPFRGAPFNLTYNRGHGDCREPVSRVEACTHPSRLLLKFQACPNVDKTESKSEELECLAQWREGSNHYLMGKVEGPLGTSNFEEKYRCFIWERIRGQDKEGQLVTVGYRVAQSGDATCAGVQSATEGARALTLMKLSNETAPGKCKYPQWLTSHHWQSLDGNFSFKNFHHKNTTLIITEMQRRDSSQSGGNYFGAQTENRFGTSFLRGGSRLTCTNRVDVSNNHVRILAQYLDECKSEFICLNIIKRDTHVIEVEATRVSGRDDCPTSSSSSLSPNLGSLTFLSTSAVAHRCPNLGKYLASGVSTDGRVVRDSCGGSLGDFKAVAVGCGDGGRMEFHSNCATQEPITSYACYGSWREKGTGFLIASPTISSSRGIRRFCFVYTETDEGLRVSSSSESCRKNINPGVEGSWAFNLTTRGPCAERLMSAGSVPFLSSFLPIISVILTCMFIFSPTSS